MITEETSVADLLQAGEPIAAGYFELPDAPPIRRMARGLRRHFEHSPLPDWRGEPLYPSGFATLPEPPSAIRFSYTSSLVIDRGSLDAKIRRYEGTPAGDALRRAKAELSDIYVVGSSVPPELSLGGGGYTHSIPNYGRILREGLNGYRDRLERRASGQETDRLPFYEAMRDLLAGLDTLMRRIRERLRDAAKADASRSDIAETLIAALDRVPFDPARNFYEALVGANLIWYLDGCDSLGRFDADLGAFLEADLKSGALDRETALEWVKLLWRNVNDCSGWNVALGGSDESGEPAYNALTELCLEAGIASRRPNLALRVRPDMPDRIWELTADSIASGCGLPALYNETLYVESLPGIYPEMDADRFHVAFGGCTETMVHGRSNVGSIDGGINLLSVFSRSLREDLLSSPDYETFISRFLRKLRETVEETVAGVNLDQMRKAKDQPQPIRSLFIDDCLDRGADYNAGGARYNSGVINLGGLANVADSLAVLKALVFEGDVSRETMLSALDAGYVGFESLRSRALACPKFGNDDDRVDEIAVRVAREAFAEIRRHRCWRGGSPFMPACIMFVTYADAGRGVPATPDGRSNREPLADSIGPMQGRDASGPTAMIRSICKLPLREAIGTPIVNLRLAPELFKTAEGRKTFRSLIRSYFAMGGMQIQVSVVDTETLRDALEHPERHGDLIIRIGGYSEYFNNLSEDLKRSILLRTEHRS